MLPEQGTPEREQIEQEALNVGSRKLEEHGTLLAALYHTYMHFRQRFIDERELMDRPPSDWTDAMTDARQLEAYVDSRWQQTIHSHTH